MKRLNMINVIGMDFFITVMLMLLISCEKETSYPENETCQTGDTLTAIAGNNRVWTEYLGTDTTVLAFPDPYANYWTYSFARTSENMGFRITGEFGDCRYMNFAVYELPSAVTSINMKDVDIRTDCGNENPFIDDRVSDSRFYSLHIVPEGTIIKENWLNVITFDASADSLSIFLRYYLPRSDKQAGAELPGIEAFNTISGEPAELPEPFSLTSVRINMDSINNILNSFFRVESVPDQIIRFYNIRSDLYYANPDNLYLATPITRKENEVYMFRFKAPVFALTREEIPTAEVRYWSVTQSDITTRSFLGMKDEDAIIAKDGFINLVIAEDTPENRARAEGLNFMPWSVKSGKMILIYRNMLTREGFTGSFNKVPNLDGSNSMNVFLQAARVYIGEYGPAGKRMSQEEYLSNFGGFQISY